MAGISSINSFQVKLHKYAKLGVVDAFDKSINSFQVKLHLMINLEMQKKNFENHVYQFLSGKAPLEYNTVIERR